MKVFFCIFLCLFFFNNFCLSQKNIIEYDKLIRIADSNFKSNNYRDAVNYYSKAFEKNGLGKVKDRYKAAICYAILNNVDSSFVQLIRISFTGKYSNYQEIINEQKFTPLQGDPRWVGILEKIKRNSIEINQKLIEMEQVNQL